jgi:glycosyltransferase involved in cell wall biosynthesis
MVPLTSVIIPVWNRADQLPEAVASVLAQTGCDVEVIIVNDGSTDDSGVIADGLAARHDRVLAVHRENGGPAAARNTGLAACSGTWVTFLDSDDLMTPDRVAEQLAIASSVTQPAVLVGRQSFRVAPGIEPPREVGDALHVGGTHPYIMSMFLAAATIRSIGGFDESFAVSEDLELLMRLQRAGVSMIQSDNVWTIRRVFGDNLVYNADAIEQATLRAIRRNRSQPEHTR